MLSPAALWSCLIVFLLDPPPENFEQLTSGKHLLDRWLKFTFFLHFKKNQQAYLGRKLCVTVNQQHFMVWNDEEITLKEMSKFQVFLYCLSKTKQWGHPNYFLQKLIFDHIIFIGNLLQSNLAIRNFLVTLKLFLNTKCSLFLWSK